MHLGAFITQVARHEFITKRLGALYGCNGGIPSTHRPLWEGVGVGELYSYKALSDPQSELLKNWKRMRTCLLLRIVTLIF